MLKKIKNLITIPLSIYYYKTGKIVVPYLPNALWIEPTNICNLKCIMCPNSVLSQKNPGMMKMELYKKIIDESKNFVSFVILCISGESLLHPKFSEMVKYAKDNGIATYISTNCTVLTPQLSEKLLKAGLDWINFSFDGCTKEIYEKVRVNAKFEKSLSNVVQFLKLKKKLKSKTFTELQILVMDDKGLKNYHENITDFSKYFTGLPLDYIQMRKPSTWGAFFSGTKKFNAKNLSRQFSPCSYLWSSLHILWDGRIVACTSDFFGLNVLGKFPEKSLKTIWNDLSMRKFRQAMIDKKYLKFNKYCQDCDSLWEKQILGVPAGIRGICIITLNNILGINLSGYIKRFAKKYNPEFSMEIVKTKK